MIPFPSHTKGLLLVALVFSSLATWAALRYGHWRQMLDLPGRRRSHTGAIPRGGGAAIVLTLLFGLPWLGWGGQERAASAFAAALLAVAGIGWLDDHRPLSARLRLAVHLTASLLCIAALPLPDIEGAGWRVALMLLGVFWLSGCINAWNFMDGSNGLVSIQCSWLGLAMAWIFTQIAAEGQAAAWPWALLSLLLAAGCAGFLPFNFPRAKIFLGDVGSGALGLVCGVLLWVAWSLSPTWFWCLLLLPSALLVDAGLTLAWRIVCGRRWYTAHREHLYQWLIRAGASHAQVALLYLGWNLAVVLPACVAIRRWPTLAPQIAVLVFMLAAALWWFGKRGIRQRIRNRGSSA